MKMSLYGVTVYGNYIRLSSGKNIGNLEFVRETSRVSFIRKWKRST